MVAIALLSTACSQLPGASSSAGTPPASGARTGSNLAPASGRFDAEVSIPPGFPSDVPVYSHARLTAGASFASNGQVAWGMEWETADPVAKVQAYYQTKFNEGDWTLKVTTSSDMSWGAKIARKSNPQATGTLTVNADQVVNRILLSLLN